MRCILMFGSPGCGKGTQSLLLGMTHISTGEILRNSEVGRKFLAENPGKLAPDEMMDQIVKDRISGLMSDFILDGYPRTIPQATVLADYLELAHVPIIPIYLKLSHEEAVRRMLNRGRPDDTEEIIKERFKQYEELTMPVQDYLHGRSDSSLAVDASRTPEEIVFLIRHFLGEDYIRFKMPTT